MIAPRLRRRWSGRLSRTALPLLLSAAGAAAQDPSAVRVSYLANEGVLLAADGSRVLIDALFGPGLDGYPAVDESARRQIENAQGAYSGVDLVLVTHHHGDHFDASAVGRHLLHNPEALFVSTRQAVALLRRDLDDFSTIESRVRAADPAEGQAITLRHRGIVLQVFNLHHGRYRQPPVDNLGFLVEMADRTILHVGDTEASPQELSASGALERPIDLALVPFWHLTGSWADLLRHEVRPGAVAAMHLPAPDAPASYFGPAGDLDALVKEIETISPGARVLSRPGQSLTLAPAARLPGERP